MGVNVWSARESYFWRMRKADGNTSSSTLFILYYTEMASDEKVDTLK